MEYALRVSAVMAGQKSALLVLILVVMEYAL